MKTLSKNHEEQINLIKLQNMKQNENFQDLKKNDIDQR